MRTGSFSSTAQPLMVLNHISIPRQAIFTLNKTKGLPNRLSQNA
jgi:hypothetical protein